MKFILTICFYVSAIIGGSLLTGCVSGMNAASDDRATLEGNFVEDYRLGVGDKIRMIVYNEEGLSGEFQIAANGAIALPLIGDVKAMGKTTSQVAVEVQGLLANGYLRDPKVSMEVLTYRPFFILGEVKSPGQYPYTNGLTVLNAVATAEGFTPRSERKVVFIRRSGSTEEKAYRISPGLRVWPGDTIRLGERYF